MEEEENIYDKIQEIFGQFPDNLNILEESINIDLQMEYFEFSKKIKKDLNSSNVLSAKEHLFDHEKPVSLRKKLLVQLASIEEVEAYRTIEKYLHNPDPELRDWAMLAFQESRMLLQSKFLDENQVFISTGLGGKGSSLRYFVVLIAKEAETFTELQKKIIKNEFDFTLKKHKGELENIGFEENFATLMTIVPIKVSIRDVFKEAIGESNQYGDFLKANFIVTNVKKLSLDEIKDFIHKQKELGDTGPEESQ
jgi:hypothetical protein